jgi:hypothetical protein
METGDIQQGKIENMSILPHPSIICLIALESSMLGNEWMQRI